ncbi:MAG: hypothetical protein GYB55_22590 [Cytophagales bacterium]|uniref:hypothetical protein n=1 Tax=Cyclobacterium marinum TaxID=104 RepID=UPI0030D87427|nr:hypothetical protein [Cytophagales bacterium]|tara:strand:- start:60894 stop:61388 length:495 start_codon:yes stop_codon:yes gene_type:complete
MERYRIGLLNHLKALLSLLFVGVIMLGVLFWLNFDETVVVIFGIFFLADAIPALYLHLEYWLSNMGEQYEINTNAIIRYKDGDQLKYSIENIYKVILYKSASMGKGGIPFLAIESYYYARVIFKSGEELIITRLLTSKLEDVVRSFKGVPFVSKKRLFCTIFWK